MNKCHFQNKIKKKKKNRLNYVRKTRYTHEMLTNAKVTYNSGNINF